MNPSFITSATVFIIVMVIFHLIEVAKGYSFEHCAKINKIIKIKKWKKYYTSVLVGVDLVKC